MIEILKDRQKQVFNNSLGEFQMQCDRKSLAGSVSQRACSFCGSRVVLYPITDALHLIHGPVGCASYTWDIRGALSSGRELHRLSFTTDLREKNVIYGGEPKLERSLDALIERHQPKAAFVYSTCIVAIIGDDVEAVCKRVSNRHNIPVIAVASEGFKGSKKSGYSAACNAIFHLMGTGPTESIPKYSLNILGDYNLAGEIWIIADYYRRMGVEVVATITGDGKVDDIRRAHGASLNVVQCSGSVTQLAQRMKKEYGIPFLHVSYFGIEDMARALYEVADHFGDAEMKRKAQAIVKEEVEILLPQLQKFRQDLQGKRAAIYTGGAFKAFSLVRSLRTLGMSTVVAGSQTGNKDDYKLLAELCDPGTVLVDDTNPLELAKFMQEQNVDLFIGGVKERPIAFKLGVAFCDHNHERKEALAGFEGMLNFAKEVHASVMSPVWGLIRREKTRRSEILPLAVGE